MEMTGSNQTRPGTLALDVQNISVIRGGRKLLNNVSFQAQTGEVVALLGPNGAGKSTLFRAITDEMSPDDGQVLLNGLPIGDWHLGKKALTLGILPQSSTLNFPFSVREVVLLGRSPCKTSREENSQIVDKALDMVDAAHLVERDYTNLSGGEKQRVHLARVLVQIWDQPEQGQRVLLLDEPTSALDPAHQHKTLSIAREFAKQNVAVVVILHDLNLASQYADRLVMLCAGHIEANGTADEVLKPDLLQRLLDIKVCIMRHPVDGYPLVVAG